MMSDTKHRAKIIELNHTVRVHVSGHFNTASRGPKVESARSGFSSRLTRCDSVLFWLRAAIAGSAAWYFRQRSVPIRRPSLAGHDLEETTKDALSSNDEYALINNDLDEDDGDSRFSSHHGRSGSVASYDAHPGNPIPWGGEGSAYYGIGGHGPVAWNNGKRLFNLYNLEYEQGDFLQWVGGRSKQGILSDEGTWEEEEEAIDI
ncbi:hypothetical protein HOY80DRAFT_975846 [Tuber brumale]|nr:hypothetical protein HOY80DRAFT_975846 [Tuber brumale]